MQQKWNQNFDGEPMTDIPQKFLNAGCDVYMVMQLRHDEKILDERFASMRELHRRGKMPDPEHYEVTYYADLPAMWQDVPNNEILEELFQLDAEFAELLTQKKAAYPDYRKARNEMQELVRAQKNVERFFAEEKENTEKTQTR